jgi:hypothetical protein
MAAALVIITLAGLGAVAAIYAFGITAGLTFIPIMLLGAGLMMVGKGIQAAATGFESLAASMEVVSPSRLWEIADALGMIALAMVATAAGVWALTFGVSALAAVAVFAELPLFALGIALLMIGTGIALATVGMATLISSFAELSDAEAGLEAISKVIEVSTNMDSSALENLDDVAKKVIEINASVSAGNSQNLEAMAKILGARRGAKEEGANKKQVILQLNQTKLGDVIVDIVQDRFDLTAK